MTMARWEPLVDMAPVTGIVDRLFDEAFRSWPLRGEDGGARRLALNMYETAHEVVVKAPLPGVRPDDVEITIEQGRLTIRARRSEQAEQESLRWRYRELWGGEFVRSIVLPNGLQEDKAEASFEHGVLTLRLPKTAEARPRQIRIKGLAQEKDK